MVRIELVDIVLVLVIASCRIGSIEETTAGALGAAAARQLREGRSKTRECSC